MERNSSSDAVGDIKLPATFRLRSGRTVMMPIRVPPTLYPGRIRVSSLAGWWWCAERSRLQIAEGIHDKRSTKATTAGTELHAELFDNIPRKPWEDEFLEEMAEMRNTELGFVRRIGDTELYEDLTGHPDDFQVSPGGEVSIIEGKTTGMKNAEYVQKYVMSAAEWQTKLYAYLLTPYAEAKGYSIAKYHAVVVFDQKRPPSLLDWRAFPYNEAQVETFINQCFEAYADPAKVIPCANWKCRSCSETYKARCQFQLGTRTCPQSL